MFPFSYLSSIPLELQLMSSHFPSSIPLHLDSRPDPYSLFLSFLAFYGCLTVTYPCYIFPFLYSMFSNFHSVFNSLRAGIVAYMYISPQNDLFSRHLIKKCGVNPQLQFGGVSICTVLLGFRRDVTRQHSCKYCANVRWCE